MSEQNITVKRTVSNNWFLLKIALQEAPLYTLQELTTRARHRVIVFIEHIYMIGYIAEACIYCRDWTAAAPPTQKFLSTPVREDPA